jgi:hypothetical protein
MQLPLFEVYAPNRKRTPTASKTSAGSPSVVTLLHPQQILERAISVLGAVDLDVYSLIPNSSAKQVFMPRQDGLRQEWRGRIWMHGVPGRSLERWIDKLCDSYESDEGTVTSAIALLPARLNARWWLRLAKYPFCAVQNGVATLKPDGTTAKMSNPATVVYWGPQLSRFASVFVELGPVYIPYS